MRVGQPARHRLDPGLCGLLPLGPGVTWNIHTERGATATSAYDDTTPYCDCLCLSHIKVRTQCLAHS